MVAEDLVLEATALVDQLFQDPTVVEDPDRREVARLRELYTDDSPTPDGVMEQLEAMVDEGTRARPSPSGVFRDLGVHQMGAVDENTVRFRVCATEDSETIDNDGEVVAQRAQVTQGAGEARRVDGVWRFYGIHPEDERTLPIATGTARPGFCDSLYTGQGVGDHDR